MHTPSDRYGDMDLDDLDENRTEDGEPYFSLEPDDDKEIDFDKTFQRGEVRSFETDFGYQLDSSLADLEAKDPEWSDEFDEKTLSEFVREVE